jgi:hypothetical protein
MDNLKLSPDRDILEFKESSTYDLVFARFGKIVDTYLKLFVKFVGGESALGYSELFPFSVSGG